MEWRERMMKQVGKQVQTEGCKCTGKDVGREEETGEGRRRRYGIRSRRRSKFRSWCTSSKAAGRRHSTAEGGMAGFPLRLLKSAGDNRTAKMCLQVGARRELGILS